MQSKNSKKFQKLIKYLATIIKDDNMTIEDKWILISIAFPLWIAETYLRSLIKWDFSMMFSVVFYKMIFSAGFPIKDLPLDNPYLLKLWSRMVKRLLLQLQQYVNQMEPFIPKQLKKRQTEMETQPEMFLETNKTKLDINNLEFKNLLKN